MKIYPSHHIVMAKDKASPFDIPLSYIESKEESAGVSLLTEPDYTHSASQSYLEIHQKFTDPDTYFFTPKKERVTDIELKRVGQEYMYNPSAIEFVPQTFSYRTILKRSGSYRTDVIYPIYIGVLDKGDSNNFYTYLAALFGNASVRQAIPSNVEINDNSTNPNSLVNMSYEKADFVFISTKNGSGSVSVDNKRITVQDILDTNCNVWLSVESFGETMRFMTETVKDREGKDVTQYVQKISCALHEPSVTTISQYTIPGYYTQFLPDVENTDFPMTDFEYINIFDGICPVLILHKKNKGYIIVSQQLFLTDIQSNAKLIYEILMYVYLKSYVHTKTRTEWITDDAVDFYHNQNIVLKQNHPSISILSDIKEDLGSVSIPMDVVDVLTSENVDYDHIGIRGDMHFKKTQRTDPERKNGNASLYTSSGTILYFDNIPVILLLEDTVSWSYVRNSNGSFILTVEPYKSSSRHVDTERQSFVLDNNISDYILYIEPNRTVLGIVPKSKYKSEMGEQMAAVSIQRQCTLNSYDLRILGGGEASPITNYDMIDEGNLLGWPYRVGCTLFFRIPKEYKPYKDRIQEQVERNISSGEYPVLVFE